MWTTLFAFVLFLVSKSGGQQVTPSQPGNTTCVMPPNPPHGEYEVDGEPLQPGGSVYDSFYLITTCETGYKVQGKRVAPCSKGVWMESLPQCVPKAQPLGLSNQPTPSERIACVVPEKAPGTNFIINGDPSIQPRKEFDSIHMLVNCDAGYTLQGARELFCVQGSWSKNANMSSCVQNRCHLPKSNNIDYFCKVSEKNRVDLYKECDEYVLVGTVVTPECKSDFDYDGIIKKMTCLGNAKWDRIISCTTVKITSAGCGQTMINTPLITGGNDAEIGEIPWHTAIYDKGLNPPKFICGGTLVSNTVVISAAHCFYRGAVKAPPSRYAVAVGKIYRFWGDENDIHAQKSDVEGIYIPERYFGNLGNYQEDIAVLRLVNSFEFTRYVSPVCLDFDTKLDGKQLKDNNIGKVAGWGFTTAAGDETNLLQTAKLPYINLRTCIDGTPPSYKPYITSDKICAGYNNGTAVCKGDSGGGLTFPDTVGGVRRYYLRGIVSTAPNDGNTCNAYSWATFTHVVNHKNFIKSVLKS